MKIMLLALNKKEKMTIHALEGVKFVRISSHPKGSTYCFFSFLAFYSQKAVVSEFKIIVLKKLPVLIAQNSLK